MLGTPCIGAGDCDIGDEMAPWGKLEPFGIAVVFDEVCAGDLAQPCNIIINNVKFG